MGSENPRDLLMSKRLEQIAILKSIREIKSQEPSLLRHPLSGDSTVQEVLHAYREGDAEFAECVVAIGALIESRVEYRIAEERKSLAAVERVASYNRSRGRNEPAASISSGFTTFDTSRGHCGICGSLGCGGDCMGGG